MKFSGLITSTFAAVAVAAPAALPAQQSVEAVQAEKAGCTVGFIFARGSTEPSPLVSYVLVEIRELLG